MVWGPLELSVMAGGRGGGGPLKKGETPSRRRDVVIDQWTMYIPTYDRYVLVKRPGEVITVDGAMPRVYYGVGT